MKRFVLNVLVFSAVFAAAEGIKCYVCSSTEDDCAKDKLEADKAKYLKTCPSSSFDSCTKTWVKKNNTTEVVNACTTKAACDAAKKACDYTTDGKCAISCCATEECNAGLTRLPTEGIKCYSCKGTEDDCAKDKLEADKAKYLWTCPSALDRCAKSSVKKDNTTQVVNGCGTKAICDAAKKFCDNYTEGPCDVSCCVTDGCNAGSFGETPEGIKCYSCKGTEDDCAKDKLEADKAKYLMTCPSSYDRCLRTWVKNDIIGTVVQNRCASKTACDAKKKQCDDITDGQCAVSCCYKDECNVGSSVSFSGFVITVCSILGLALFNQA